MGDFLLALPVLEGLYRSYPHIRMDFCLKPEHASLIRKRPYTGQIHPYDSPEFTPFYHEDLYKAAPVPSVFQGADVVFVFGQSAARLFAERLSERMTAAKVCWVRSFTQTDHSLHSLQPVSRFLVEQVRAHGWDIDYSFPRLEIDPDALNEARTRLAGAGLREGIDPVLIHPGSGGRKKIWPLGRWWALIRWLRLDRGVPVLLSLGPADEHLRPFAQNAAHQFGIHILEALSLTELAAFLAISNLYIGSDSGVSHLAAATGIPSLVIFGPTAPEIWAPQGPNVRIVRSHWDESEVLAWSPALPEAGPEARVQEAVAELLG